jgi:hypothetical protein
MQWRDSRSQFTNHSIYTPPPDGLQTNVILIIILDGFLCCLYIVSKSTTLLLARLASPIISVRIASIIMIGHVGAISDYTISQILRRTTFCFRTYVRNSVCPTVLIQGVWDWRREMLVLVDDAFYLMNTRIY